MLYSRQLSASLVFRGKAWAGDSNVGFFWPEIWMGLLREKEQRGEAVQVVRSESRATPAFRGWKKRATSKGTK